MQSRSSSAQNLPYPSPTGTGHPASFAPARMDALAVSRESPLHILLIEDNPGDVRLVKEMLYFTKNKSFHLDSVVSLAAAEEWLVEHRPEIILLDLSLPDSQGVDTFLRLRAAAPMLPIVVLSGSMDEEVAIEAVRQGAQDYLVKGIINGDLLTRSLHYAMARHRAEAQMRASEQLVTSTLNALSAHIAILDKDGCIIAVNKAWNDYATQKTPVAGAKSATFGVGANYLSICDASSGPYSGEALERAQIIRDVIAGRLKEYVRDYPCHSPAEERWFNWRVTRFPGEGPTMVVVAHEDVTRQKLAEENLLQNYNILMAVMGCTPDPIFVKDKQNRYMLVNSAFAKQVGRTSEEIVGVSDAEIFSADMERNTSVINNMILQTGADASYELTLPINGKLHTLLISKGPYRDLNGNILGIVGNTHDITERKIAEDSLRRIAAAARCLLWYADVEEKDGELVWEMRMADEEAAQRLFPLTMRIGDSYASVWSQARVNEATQQMNHHEQCCIRAGTSYRQEFRCRRDDGELRWLSEEVDVENVAPNRWRAVGVCLDVTERKLLESQLSHAQKMESIGQLAAGMAHEINTPTQFIGDNMHFLNEAFEDVVNVLDKQGALLREAQRASVRQALTEEAQAAVEQAQAAVEQADLAYLLEEIPTAIQQAQEGNKRVAQIVQAMKEFSHPGTQSKVNIDINRAIANTVVMARNEWKYVAEIKTELADDMPMIPCLPSELNQVILNIIVNAAHAIADKLEQGANEKGLITITTRQSQGWAEISIKDTGCGIPQDMLPRIFNPFFTTKEVGKGTGQGLAIAHDIVVGKHGGHIDVDTAVGHGTTFRIRLPLTIDGD